MNTEKIYITKTLIKDLESEDLTYALQDEFGFDHDTHDEFVEIEKVYGRAEGEPISLDSLIKDLTILKDLGATHVEMGYHVDHRAYEYSAFKIEKSTEAEIEEYESAKATRAEKRKEIEALEVQLSKLKREI